jgi:hypothetical protein
VSFAFNISANDQTTPQTFKYDCNFELEVFEGGVLTNGLEGIFEVGRLGVGGKGLNDRAWGGFREVGAHGGEVSGRRATARFPCEGWERMRAMPVPWEKVSILELISSFEERLVGIFKASISY